MPGAQFRSRLSNAGDTEGNLESSGPHCSRFYIFDVSAEVTRYKIKHIFLNARNEL